MIRLKSLKLVDYGPKDKLFHNLAFYGLNSIGGPRLEKSDPSRDHGIAFSRTLVFMELLSGVVYWLFTVLNTVIKGRALARTQIATQIQK